MSEQAYLDHLKYVLENGVKTQDRTGVGTLSVFGGEIRYDLSNNTLPLFTTKKVFWKGILIELLWLLQGRTDIEFLKKHNVTIWDEWLKADNTLGPVYPKQWRNFEGVDQIAQVIDSIKNNPTSRRHIVSAWNPKDLPDMALPPCHAFFQFYVSNGELSCKLYQRSSDLFLGNPYNVASYSALTHLIAYECGLRAKEFIHSFGDSHIYLNHLSQVKELLGRNPYTPPKLKISLNEPLLDFVFKTEHLTWNDIKQVITLEGYQSHGAIKGDVAV